MWAPISTDPSGRTRTSARPRAAAFAGLLVALATAGIGTAAPAAAIDDPTRPDATVTRAPSCRPGGLVVEVVAGTLPYEVRLATTREPDGEDEALLQPGDTAVLSTGDVEPGETIDARLEYTAQDGSGSSYVDELEEHTYTRPTLEDCDLATAPPVPPAPEPPPTGSPEPPPVTPEPEAPTPPAEPEGTPAPTPAPEPSTVPAPTAPGPPAPTEPRPSEPGPTEPRPTEPGPTDERPSAPTPGTPRAPEPQAGAAPAPVAAGGVVRVRVEGYQPGEEVTIALHGSDEVLASATADEDGEVVAEVLIPAWTASGPASLDVVGTGAAAVVPLDVAAAADGTEAPPSRLPLLLAAGALTATATGLVTTTARRRAARR